MAIRAVRQGRLAAFLETNRLGREWTQVYVAERLSELLGRPLSQSYYQRIEKGGIEHPNRRVLEAFAQLFTVPVEELLELTADEGATGSLEDARERYAALEPIPVRVYGHPNAAADDWESLVRISRDEAQGAQALAGYRVTEDTAFPIVLPRDVVVVSPELLPREGYLYCYADGDRVACRYLAYNNGQLVLRAVEVPDLPINAVQPLGRVLMITRQPPAPAPSR